MKLVSNAVSPAGILVALILASVVLAAPPLSAGPPLQMSLDGDELVIGELAPGAEIVYFTVSRFSEGFVPRTERRSERLVDDDGDGEIRVVLERAAPPKFLAVAVELGSGRFDVWTPEGSPAREIALPANTLLEGPGHRFDRLENDRAYVELLLVRPSSLGAWTLTTGDGAASDESPSSDGLVRTSIAAMEPVGTSDAPPEEYEKDDLLVRVAPREMEFYVARIVR